MPGESDEPEELPELEFDQILDMFFSMFRARPDLKARADELAEQEYRVPLHEFAHRLLMLGAIDLSCCDIALPILGVVFAAGYVRCAFEDSIGQAPDIEQAASGPAMSEETLRRLMGQIGEDVHDEVPPD